jgi:hypothetical protein
VGETGCPGFIVTRVETGEWVQNLLFPEENPLGSTGGSI